MIQRKVDVHPKNGAEKEKPGTSLKLKTFDLDLPPSQDASGK